MDSGIESEKTYLLSSAETVKTKRKLKQASKLRKTLILMCCFFMLVVSNGVGYGLVVMYVEIQKAFDAPRTQAALVQSIFMGVMTAGELSDVSTRASGQTASDHANTGILYTPLLRRFGIGACVAMGTLVGCTGLVISAFAKEIYMIIIFTGIVGGIGISINYFAPFIIASLLFRENSGMPLVFLTTGSSVGQFIFTNLYEMFISHFGWRGAFILMSGIALNILPVALIVCMSKNYMNPYVEKEPEKNNNNNDNNKQEDKRSCGCSFDMSLLSDAMIWLILSVCFLQGSTGNTESWFLVDLLTMRGYERKTASFLVSMAGFANLFGRSTGVLMRFKIRIPTIYHWIYCLPVLGVAHFLVLSSKSYVPSLSSCLLYGYTLGLVVSLKATVMFEAAGLHKYASGMGLLNICYGSGNFFCGLIGGIIKDTNGDYDLMFYLSIIASLYMSLASAIVVFILKRRQRLDRIETSQTTRQDTKYQSIGYQNLKDNEEQC